MAMISIQSIEQGFYTKADWNNQFVLHVFSMQSPEVLLFINRVGMCTLKGYVFLRRFGVESGMGTTEVHERINLSFGFQMNKKKKSIMQIRNGF